MRLTAIPAIPADVNRTILATACGASRARAQAPQPSTDFSASTLVGERLRNLRRLFGFWVIRHGFRVLAIPVCAGDVREIPF